MTNQPPNRAAHPHHPNPHQHPSPLHHHHHHHHRHQQRRTVDLRIPAIEKYAYCLCLHVKPTTIFIAVFKLTRALLFASILLNAELTINEQMNDVSSASLHDPHRSTSIAIVILTRICMAAVSAVGIYAVFSGRAPLLLPLYAMLLIDFFFSLPAFYSRDLDASIAEGLSDLSTSHQAQPQLPGSEQFNRYSSTLLAVSSEILKIYFLCVIWKCYRYLRLIELVTPIRLSEIYPHLSQAGGQYPTIVRVIGGTTEPSDLEPPGFNAEPPPYDSVASSMKPPNYEEAMKSSNFLFPPVNSSAAISNNLGQMYQQHNADALETLNSEQQEEQQQQNVIGNDESVTTEANSTTTTTTISAGINSRSTEGNERNGNAELPTRDTTVSNEASSCSLNPISDSVTVTMT